MKRLLASLARASRVIVEAGLLAVLPLFFSRSFSEQFTYPKRVLGEILIIVAAVAWLLVVLWRTPAVSRPSARGLTAPLVLLALAVLISCVNSPVPAFSLRDSVYFLCGPAWALVLMGWTVESHEMGVWRLYAFSALGGTVVALITVLQWAGLDPLLFGGYGIEWGSMVARMRLYATFGNPNFVAGYLIATVFLGAALAVRSARRAVRAAWGAAVAIMLVALVGTGSRGAWTGLAAGLVAATLVLKSKSRRPAGSSCTASPEEKPPAAANFWQAKLCAACCVALFSAGLPAQAGWRDLLNAGIRHLEGRVFLWRAAWPMFTEHPMLGGGWATFQLRFLDLQARCLAAHPEMVRHWSNIRQLHNDLLQFLLETGGLGLLGWGWVLWAYAKRLRNSQAATPATYQPRTSPPIPSAERESTGLAAGQRPSIAPSPQAEGLGTGPATRLWLAASVGGITAILVDSLFNFQFAIPPTFILMFTLLAVPEILANRERVSEPKAIETPPIPPGLTSHQVASRVVGAALGWFQRKSRRVSGKRNSALPAVWRFAASLGVVAVAVLLLVQVGREAVAERDYALGRQLEVRGEIARAEEVYRHGIQANPLNGRLHFGLARVLYLSERYPEALVEIPRAERTFADSHLEVLKARIQDQMGLAGPALATYRRALALDPTLKTVQRDIERLSGTK